MCTDGSQQYGAVDKIAAWITVLGFVLAVAFYLRKRGAA